MRLATIAAHDLRREILARAADRVHHALLGAEESREAEIDDPDLGCDLGVREQHLVRVKLRVRVRVRQYLGSRLGLGLDSIWRAG